MPEVVLPEMCPRCAPGGCAPGVLSARDCAPGVHRQITEFYCFERDQFRELRYGRFCLLNLIDDANLSQLVVPLKSRQSRGPGSWFQIVSLTGDTRKMYMYICSKTVDRRV